MPDLAFDLRYLKYALLVAEHGSIRRAAAALNISQSTLSRRIQLLERRIGTSLFERTPTGIRKTSSGEKFLLEAAVGAEYLHQAVHKLALAKRGYLGELRVGLPISMPSSFIANLLGAYHHQYPAIEMKLDEASFQKNASDVQNGLLDAAFVPDDPNLPGCPVRKLWDENVYVVVPESHELAQSRNVSWNDISRETLLLSRDNATPNSKDCLLRKFSRLDHFPKISVQSVGRDNLISMVAQGFGITMTTTPHPDLIYPGVRFLQIADSEGALSASVTWHASNVNPSLKLFLALSFAQALSHIHGASGRASPLEI